MANPVPVPKPITYAIINNGLLKALPRPITAMSAFMQEHITAGTILFFSEK